MIQHSPVERLGSWIVEWRPDGFSIRADARADRQSDILKDLVHFDFFRFHRIILPVEIVTSGFFAGLDRVRLTIDPPARIETLYGASRPDLERFARRVSFEAIAAAGRPQFCCADCADEAGREPGMWDGNLCASCRLFYCRNSHCLRRLRLDILRNGAAICHDCGAANPHALPTPDRPTRTTRILVPA